MYAKLLLVLFLVLNFHPSIIPISTLPIAENEPATDIGNSLAIVENTDYPKKSINNLPQLIFNYISNNELQNSSRNSSTIENGTVPIEIVEIVGLDPVQLANNNNNKSEAGNRQIRQEQVENVNSTNTSKNATANQTEFENSAEDDDDDDDNDNEGGEGGQNMITGLISAFLSGLSTPEGGVDVDAITTLLGSLSSQNPDGTYNFQGLTDILMSFFGGDSEEGGGGSNFGAFLGGLVGAFLKGIAQPPNANGVGSFTSELLQGILPALERPGAMGQNPLFDLDLFGFLSGFLANFSQGKSTGNNSTMNSPQMMSPPPPPKPSFGMGSGDPFGSKFSLFKGLISMLTSMLTASSGSSSGGGKFK